MIPVFICGIIWNHFGSQFWNILEPFVVSCLQPSLDPSSEPFFVWHQLPSAEMNICYFPCWFKRNQFHYFTTGHMFSLFAGGEKLMEATRFVKLYQGTSPTINRSHQTLTLGVVQKETGAGPLNYHGSQCVSHFCTGTDPPTD